MRIHSYQGTKILLWKLGQGHFAALVIGRCIGTRRWSIQVVAIYAGGIEMLEGAGARPGEMGSGAAYPNTVRDHFDGKTDSNGPGACFLTPWRERCGKWLKKHLGGVWVGGSLCVGSGDMEDILCGLDMEGFVEKVDYSVCPQPNPFHFFKGLPYYNALCRTMPVINVRSVPGTSCHPAGSNL